jgi:hypothetical protein
LVRFCSSITTTTLSRIVVRAFVGPRPVYSRKTFTIMVEIAAGSELPFECWSASVETVIRSCDLAFPEKKSPTPGRGKGGEPPDARRSHLDNNMSCGKLLAVSQVW